MKILNLIISPLAALLLAPLLAGIVVRVKANFAGRKGQPVVQVYYNLYKLFKKGTVYSKTTSWIFRIAPAIIFSLTLAATCFIPIIGINITPVFPFDVILMIYLLGLARFFLIISAMDTGSAFEGMGASREAFYSALVEPVLFICMITLMKVAHSSSIAVSLFHPDLSNSIITMFIGIPIFILLLAENARIPFDDPTTHLELTMIHEVMILDNSGPSLALLEYAAAIKLWFFSLILALVLLPAGNFGVLLQTGIIMVIMVLIVIIVGIIESIMARTQLYKIPQILFTAGIISLLGFFIIVTDVLKW